MEIHKMARRSKQSNRGFLLLICIFIFAVPFSLASLAFAAAGNDLLVKAVGDTYLKVSPEGSITLAVDASCGSGNMTYQWRKSKDPYYLRFSNTDIVGATNAAYTTDALSEQTHFRCIVTDTFGNSDYVDYDVRIENLLTVNGMRWGWNQNHIFIQPGESADLKVDASCDVGELTYKWDGHIYNFKAQKFDHINLADINGDEYTTSPLNCIANYRCEVSDCYGNSLEAYYYINIDSDFEAVGFSNAIEDESGKMLVQHGESVTLEVATISKADEITYQWYNPDGSIVGATEAQYTTPPITRQTDYYCDVMDSFGHRKLLYFTICVDNELTAEVITGEDLTVHSGDSAVFAVRAGAKNGAVHYTWEVWCDEPSMSSQTGEENTFTLENITKSAEVYCMVYDDYGNDEYCYFYVSVIEEAEIPSTDLSVEAVSPYLQVAESGETVILKAKISGGDGDIKYKWYDWNDDVYSGMDSLRVSLRKGWNRYELKVSDNNSDDSVGFIVAVKSSERTLAPGKQIRVDLNSPDYVVYSFIPEATGDYTLKFMDNDGCDVAVYNTNGDLLGGSINHNYVYSLTTARLTAGQEYYYLIQTGGDNGGGSHIMTLTSNVISSDGETLQLPVGQSLRFPGNVISITSDSTDIISVSGLMATINKAGTATISVTFEDSSRLIYTIMAVNANVLRLPADLTVVESEAFSGDESIEYVELGSSVQRISSYAFKNTKNLKIVVVNSATTRLMPGAFSGAEPLIICPDGSMAAAYAEANGLAYLYSK